MTWASSGSSSSYNISQAQFESTKLVYRSELKESFEMAHFTC